MIILVEPWSCRGSAARRKPLRRTLVLCGTCRPRRGHRVTLVPPRDGSPAQGRRRNAEEVTVPCRPRQTERTDVPCGSTGFARRVLPGPPATILLRGITPS